ncbi:hypothetical protein [Micromonospora sp. CA-244673]|uniref:hypothetical protein n=1 Tax=Micromonospora sp. CA-244673 TaxID=3239958 RepID=UPI003D8C72D1
MGRVPRIAAALAFSLLVPMTTAGCSRFFGCAPQPAEDITESDLAGVYTSPEGGRIELGEDGRYSTSNLPGASEEGTWSLDLDSGSTEDLRLEDLQLWISGSRGKPWLYRFDGDPDNCDLIEFHRAR